jgi:hypothetical protein
MRIPVRPLAAAALAVPLLAGSAPAGAGELTDYQDVEATFTSTATGDEVSCWFSAYTSREHEGEPDGWSYTSTESSGDFAECYQRVRVETHATWIDSTGRTVRVSQSENSFIDVIRLQDVASNLVVRHEVTYGQCDRHDQCHYELETATK